MNTGSGEGDLSQDDKINKLVKVKDYRKRRIEGFPLF